MFKVLLLMISVQWSTLAATRDELLEYENVVDTNKYNFRYITHSGVTREEVGQLTNQGTPEQAFVVKGRTVNFFPDGSMQIVEYVADRFGYHPKITFLTSSQLAKMYVDAASKKTTAKPEASEVPQDSPDDKKALNRFAADDEEDVPPPGNNKVKQDHLNRVPPQRRPVSAANRTKPIAYSSNASEDIVNDDDYDYYDDINNRIGSGTAAALLGIG